MRVLGMLAAARFLGRVCESAADDVGMTTTARPRPSARLAETPTGAALRRAELWRSAAVAIIWLTSLAVVAFWVAGGGLEALVAGPADAITTLGRITGLVAANLLLYQVLLMARVPVFERGFGRDAIARLHRLTGFWSFWLMLAHIALITVGYAMTAGIGLVDQAWSFVVDYPGMLLATAGTALLIGVVVLSIRAARRRLRYESWHLLHLYGYLGVGLALPHQLWTGNDFLTSPAATVYWWGAWIVTAACVLWFRIGVPIARSLRHRLRVAEVVPDGARGVTVRIAGDDIDRLNARAGQFFVWRFLDGPGWSRGHPFSLSSRPGETFTVSARTVGDGTRRLGRLRPGTRVLIEGPYGTMTGERRRAKRLLMLGAGAGVAPLVAILEEQRWRSGDAALVTRDHDPADAILVEPIKELVRRRGLQWYRLDGPRTRTGAPWLPERYAGLAPSAAIRSMIGDPRDCDVYVCGPGPWMDAVIRDLVAMGVARSQIHAESFSI